MLRARFADARFFWETDQKQRLGEYLPKLSQVTYESRLGSYGDKVERMRSLARWIAEQWFSGGNSRRRTCRELIAPRNLPSATW